MKAKLLFRKYFLGTGVLLVKTLLEIYLEARKRRLNEIATYGESCRNTIYCSCLELTEVSYKFFFEFYKWLFFIK